MYKIVVFISEQGTNLEAIIDSCDNHIINAQVSLVVSNNKSALGLERAQKSNIPSIILEYDKNSEMSREEYDRELAFQLKGKKFDLVVLAGFMHVLGKEFLSKINIPIINLHSALPGQLQGQLPEQLPRTRAIERAWDMYLKGKIDYTGIMVHHVVEKIDAGSVIEQEKVPIFSTDTLESLKNRVQYFEKAVLIKSIQKLVCDGKLGLNSTSGSKYSMIYKGKVRNVYDLGYDLLLFEHSNRQSAFDRHICDIPDKGSILTSASQWWFNRTRHIISNHFIWSDGNNMICRKCKPFKIEVVVRGYITGSTSTSLWTHYKNGERNYCGIQFPDNLVKNQKLEQNILTPTIKGINKPITPQEIVSEGYMTSEEWNYISKVAFQLFEYGQIVADQRRLILVDTKYEFGVDSKGNILLIDEIHTCDSSRFWLKSSYEERFKNGLEPEKFDKDIVRSFIKSKCDPYKEPLPEIPQKLITKTRNAYMTFLSMLDKNLKPKKSFDTINKTVDWYFNQIHSEMGVILAGSKSDQAWINKIMKELDKQNIYSTFHVSSAHKNTKDVVSLMDNYNRFAGKRKMVFIAVAGMSNALGGVLAANLKYPVINCPPFKDKIGMMTDLNSSIRCPSNVPAMLILSPENVALAIKKIFDM